MTPVCRVCGAPLPAPEGSGRPRAYCDPSCRRAAEFEVRRLNARLGKLEDRASQLRIELAGGIPGPMPNRSEKRMLQRQLGAVMAEAERQQARLRALVAGGVE